MSAQLIQPDDDGMMRPYDFDSVFVRDGWRGIERYFGARTSVNLRWLDEAGRERIVALRRRYMRGDAAALEEVSR